MRYEAKIILLAALSVLLIGVGWMTSNADDTPTSSECLDCHEASAIEADKTFDAVLANSVHQGMECLDCHVTIDELPHEETLIPVDCGLCHEQEVTNYQWHGRLQAPDGDDIPTCSDCHGRHDIKNHNDRDSRVHPTRLPETCGVCHEDLDLTAKHEIYVQKPVQIYESSVHGKASLGGIYLAATCNDCHSAEGSAHRILSPGNSESPINHFNIPKTCGKCHKAIEQDYWEGIHGKLTSRGEVDSPVCTHCHGEHGIISTSDPRSPVHPVRIAEATCAPCHESAYLNEKYGAPIGRLKSFVDSYHGLKSKAGDVTVANCSSCHGAHRILPASDEGSSINPANLQETCGHCHPGISQEMALTGIHAPPGVAQTKGAQALQYIYIIAIFVIIGSMIIHWLIDLRKKIYNVLKLEQVRRMNANEVWQHTFLMVTFILLAITGFSLRYSNAWWVQLLFGWEGGFPLRGLIHRVAAVLFLLTSAWHMLYLTSARGRTFLKDMLPVKADFFQFFQMIKYNLGRTTIRPGFGRFTYVEKAEYWALVWGAVVMIITGFLLWFDNVAVHWFPKGFLNVMLVIHHYEAWLAVLAVAIWHLYSTVFSPHVYPMNPAWITGKTPAAWYKYEHPEDTEIEEVTETEQITTPDEETKSH